MQPIQIHSEISEKNVTSLL